MLSVVTQVLSDPCKPRLIKKEVESTSLLFLRVLLKRETSQVSLLID